MKKITKLSTWRLRKFFWRLAFTLMLMPSTGDRDTLRL